jgi:glycosyltransferase involved in cell wall biosynthesis
MDKRLRIAHVMAAKGGVVGGSERRTFELCAALAEKHEVHLLADKPYGVTCPKNIIFHAIDFSQSRWNPFLYWQIVQVINDIQPQIIHAQAGKAVELVSIMKWFFQHIIFVATIHSHKSINKAYLSMDGVIATNKAAVLGLSPKKTRVIYHGLKPSTLLLPHETKSFRQRLSLTPDEPLIIAIGELVPSNGFDVLLRACVGTEAKLLIVGEGGERKKLEKLVAVLALQQQVFFLGARQDVPQLLQLADLCVIPSVIVTFPTVMLEALQVGCPVIATDIGGTNEWLPEALLCPPDNVEALHTLLCDTLRRLSVLRTNYLPIFLRAQQELTINGMTQRTQEFYQALLEQHR